MCGGGAAFLRLSRVAVAAVLKISTSEGVFAGWDEQLPELS